jgi:hypothetical protein
MFWQPWGGRGERILPVIRALCCKATFWFAQGKSLREKKSIFFTGLEENNLQPAVNKHSGKRKDG